MNQLVIIGNGFDLAHGLKTSYNHFITNYIITKIEIIIKKNISTHDDNLFNYDLRGFNKNISFTDELVKVFDAHNNGSLQLSEIIKLNREYSFLKPKTDFAFALLEELKNNWVDIEKLFYNQLKQCYQDNNHDNVSQVNSDLSFLKNELVEYLSKTKGVNITINNSIIRILNNISSRRKIVSPGISPFKNKDNHLYKTHFLNFNYTNTFDSYFSYYSEENVNTNNIHGSINNIEEQVIFGYGDESESDFEQMENSQFGDNYMENMKSFWYYRTNNYSNLFNFLDSGEFEVNIIGHSCGKSDKTILSAIFNHSLCQKIIIFPYKKSEGYSDLHDKVLNISKQFPVNAKHNMRMKIKYYPTLYIEPNQ
ncbi:MAG: AbiH family protein [Bacteroidales bacterium]